MLKIGEFSKMAKLGIGTLRYYDKVGLLHPVYTDLSSNYRYYSEEQLDIVSKITKLRELGISISEIRSYLSGDDLNLILLKRKKSITNEIELLRRQLTELDRVAERGIDASYQAEIKVVPKQTVFYRDGILNDISRLHDFITNSLSEFRAHNPEIPYSDPDYCCTIYPAESYRKTEIHIRYAQGIMEKGTESRNIRFAELPEVTVVSVLHRGSETALRNAYAYAVKWAAENGYEISGPARERYIDGAWNGTKECDWLTEIQLPVKRNDG